jgi:hypothetical protein
MSEIEIEPIKTEEITRAANSDEIKVDIAAEEAAKNQVSESTANITQTIFDQYIEKQAAASRKLLSDMAEELKLNDVDGADISVALTDLEVNGVSEQSLAQNNPSVYNSFKNLVGRLSQSIENLVKKRTNSKVEKLIDDNNKAAEEYYKDPTDNAKKLAFDSTQDALRKALVDSPDEDVKKLEKQVEDSKKGSWKKWVETLVKVLKLVGIGYGIYAIIKAIADSETGCYQFKTDSNSTLTKTKLPCPSTTDDSVNCRCGNTAETCTSNQKLPYCCNAGSIAYNQPCKGQTGKPDSVYYAWEQQTFAGVLNELWKGIKDLPQELADFGSMIGKILKYLLFGVLIFVGIVILIYILKFLFSLFSKNKKNK